MGPSDRLPDSVVGGKGLSNRLNIGMGGGGVLPGIYERVSRSSIPLQTRLLLPQQARGERLESTHPGLPRTNRRTIEGGVSEADVKERGGGGVGGIG